MVTITKVTTRTTKNGGKFSIITVKGGSEVGFNKDSGQAIMHTKKASIISFDSGDSLAHLIGTQLPGDILKVKCDEYSFKSKDGEKITLDYRYQYVETDKIEGLDIELKKD